MNASGSTPTTTRVEGRPAPRSGRTVAACAAVALALAATGCGRQASSTTTTGKDTAAAASASTSAAQRTFTSPAPKGDVASFSWNLPNGEPSSLDPTKSYNYSNNTVLANLCEGLVRQNPDFSLTPSLATSYEQPSPTTWVYTIRPGVTFWDGKPLTAKDVAYSLSRNVDPKDGSFWSTPFYSNVSTIEATGADQVTVKLKQPDALFNRMMATAAGAISEQAYVEQKGAKYGTPTGGLMCTGPFSLATWRPGSEIDLTRNPSYWDAAHKAKAAKMTFKFITDESTITSALSSGGLDGTYQVPVAAIPQLQGSSAGKVTLGASTEFFAFRQTQKKGVLADPRIRRALSLALDRSAITKVVFDGAGTPANTPIAPPAWGYAKDVFQAAAEALPPVAHDIAQAKQLVQQAGSPKGRITVAVQADVRTATQSVEALQSVAKQIGLNVKIASMPSTVYSNLYFDAKARAPYDAMAVAEYGAGVAEPIVALSEFTPLSAYNYGNLRDPKVTDAIRSAIGTYDDAKRAKLVTDAQAALISAQGVIPVVNLDNTTFQSSRITGATTSLAYLYYPWAAGIGAP